MSEPLHDKDIEDATDPELHDTHLDEFIEGLDEAVGDVKLGSGGQDFLESGNTNLPGDFGPSGDVGLEELATEEELRAEAGLGRERRYLPSDLQSPGDPNAWDVGVPGGLGTGDPDGGDFGLEDNKEL